MTIEEAKQIVQNKDTSTNEKCELLVEAIKLLAGNNLKKQN